MRSFDSTVGLARFSFCALALAAASATQAATIRVPADKPTIQSAINVARAGDKVLVAPGTYREAIDFLGKSIIVISEAGAKSTVIDAQSLGKAVATFSNGESRKARLSGFTLTHGAGNLGGGGGAYISSASPTIDRNRIVHNVLAPTTSATGFAVAYGAGIGVYGGAPKIHHNLIAHNTAATSGGGIYMHGNARPADPTAEISDNTIEYNEVLDGGWDNSGGGIYMASMRAVIARNIIRYNSAPMSGGIHDLDSQATVVNNLVHGNTASHSPGGILASRSTGTYVNNTVAKNSFEQLLVSEGSPLVANNIFYGSSIHHAAVVCATSASVQFDFNNVYSTKGLVDMDGTCAASGTNLSIKPGFTGTGTHPYRLRPDSPLIDKGDSSAAAGTNLDLLNKPRFVGASVDMGAYELQTN